MSSPHCRLCEWKSPNGVFPSTSIECGQSLKEHLTTEHLKWIPFKCNYCRSIYLPTEAAIEKHFTDVHNNRLPTKVTFHFDAIKWRKLQELTDDCLGLGALQDDVQCDAKYEAVKAEVDNMPQLESYQNCIDNGKGPIVDIESNTPSADRPTSHFPVDREPEENDDNNTEEANGVNEGETEVANASFADNTAGDDSNISANERGRTKDDDRPDRRRRRCGLCDENVPTLRLHVWRCHMSAPAFECTVCSWSGAAQNNAMVHLQNHHKGRMNVLKDNRMRLRGEYNAAYRNAEVIPKRPKTSKPRFNAKSRARCSLCGQLVGGTSNNKRRHIWQWHMKDHDEGNGRMAPVICNICQHPMLSLAVATRKKHMLRHPGEKEDFRDNRPKYGDIVTERSTQAFGYTKPSINRAFRQCQLCYTKVKCENLHIWSRHMQQARYSCAMCKWEGVSLSGVIGHTEGMHAGKHLDFFDRQHDVHIIDQYSKQLRLAFGEESCQKEKNSSIKSEEKDAIEISEEKMLPSTCSGGDNTTNDSFKCGLCGETTGPVFASKGALRAKRIHIVSRHMTDDPSVRCRWCHFCLPHRHYNRQLEHTRCICRGSFRDLAHSGIALGHSYMSL